LRRFGRNILSRPGFKDVARKKGDALEQRTRENHMKLQNKALISTVLLAGLMLPAAAQTSAVAPPPGTIHARKENQQDRIAQGVKSGQLTAGETAHLEKREARINREVHNERVANGGKLTPAERRQVNRQQNRTSRAIYRDKHNARVQ
jgi:hypothetical protein